MVNKRESRQVMTILGLCLIWYVVSCSGNIVGKILLSEFPYPMTVTMVQLVSITLYSEPFFKLWGIRKQSAEITWPYYFKLIVPLALGKFVGNVFSHVSIWKVPVSYAHTVKATMPFFTVVLSRLILGEKQTWTVYASLVPIVGGVAIATVTELSFDTMGLCSALASTLAFSLQNIYSKKVLRDTGMHHLRLLLVLGRLALLMFLPIWLLYDLKDLISDGTSSAGEPSSSSSSFSSSSYRIIGLLLFDGVLSWFQNIIAFSILSIVAPLTYAVASASKRIFVIAVTLFILGNPVTGFNIFGMTLAIFGVFCYNMAKYDQRRIANGETLLPRYAGIGDSSNGYLANGRSDESYRFNV